MLIDIINAKRVVHAVKQQCPNVNVELLGTLTDSDFLTVQLGGFKSLPSDLVIYLSKALYAETTCESRPNRDDLVVSVRLPRFHDRAYSSIQLVLALALIIWIVHWAARRWYGCEGHLYLEWIDKVVPGAAVAFARGCK